jgi:hypothetical protein
MGQAKKVRNRPVCPVRPSRSSQEGEREGSNAEARNGGNDANRREKLRAAEKRPRRSAAATQGGGRDAREELNVETQSAQRVRGMVRMEIGVGG